MGRRIQLLSAMALMAVLLCDAIAATDFHIAGVEARSGYLSVEGGAHDAFAWGGSLNLGNINANSYLRVDLLYWEKSYSYPYYPGSPNFNWDLKDLATKINVLYELPMRRVLPYLGAGFTIHNYTRSYVTNYEWHSRAMSGTELGFQFFGGARYQLPHNLYVFEEGAFDRSDRDQVFAGGGLGYNITFIH